jgi:hypothetical protein
VRVRRLSVAAALAILAALFFAGSARACSCAQIAPSEALRQADGAIVGRLVKVVPRDAGQADFRYRVRSVYKGGPAIALGETISVRGSRQSAACGLPSRTGRRYGLLLAEEEGLWFGGLCGLISPRALRSAAARAGGSSASPTAAASPTCPAP